MNDSLEILMRRFGKVSALVVGDVMLDRYWWGNVDRISPEAPVPVVRLTQSSLVAGGAANVAANIAGLGARPWLVGVVGDDEGGAQLPAALIQANVDADHLLKSAERPTTVKTRVVAHQQHVVRVDHEDNAAISDTCAGELAMIAERLLADAQVLVLSDYAKGVLTPELLHRLIAHARELGLPVLVDPKGRDYERYAGATLLTPNRTEAAQAVGLDPHEPNVVLRAGELLIENLRIDSLLITEGEDGMTLFERGRDPVHLDASAQQVYDVTGAGDTVIATLGVALGAGADLLTAARIANIAAGLAVQQVGTTTVSLDQLRREFAERAGALV
ncbi:MAG: D-glycero-beta-D-manno-heptose-7-phosphate kinase [Pyrinomonadaceae bacterium]